MLNIGDQAPEFSLKSQNGEIISLSDLLTRKESLVVYFYPKDETPGCTKEACSFRDRYEDFTEAGSEVVGISGDSVESHQKFAQHRRLPFILLSDPGKKVHKEYQVGSSLFGLFSNRVTYVIDRSGTIRHAFKSQMDIGHHVNDALEIIQKIHQE